jgi:hypothetical protein
MIFRALLLVSTLVSTSAGSVTWTSAVPNTLVAGTTPTSLVLSFSTATALNYGASGPSDYITPPLPLLLRLQPVPSPEVEPSLPLLSVKPLPPVLLSLMSLLILLSMQLLVPSHFPLKLLRIPSPSPRKRVTPPLEQRLATDLPSLRPTLSELAVPPPALQLMHPE